MKESWASPLFCNALHEVIEDFGHLAAGDVVVGLEGSVGVAADDSLGRHGLDIVGGIGGDGSAVRQPRWNR